MNIQQIKRGAESLGVQLSDEQLSFFERYAGELKKWGSRMNLTALLKDESKVVEELFLDSLAPLSVVRDKGGEDGPLLDIGSGAGFPGIPLKIAESALGVVLADSSEKRVLFQRHIIRTLGLEGIEAVKARFTAEGSGDIESGPFLFVIAKAVADTATLCRWAEPHLQSGGWLICMKGPSEGGSLEDGYEAPEKKVYTLPFSGLKRYLYLYRKT
jgi:16S rRNA (guanine527-N7)-methyltransferase